METTPHDSPETLVFYCRKSLRNSNGVTPNGVAKLCLGPSVTSRSSTEMAKRRITQTTPHDSPGNLVFWCRRSRQNSNGVIPCAKCRCGRLNARAVAGNWRISTRGIANFYFMTYFYAPISTIVSGVL